MVRRKLAARRGKCSRSEPCPSIPRNSAQVRSAWRAILPGVDFVEVAPGPFRMGWASGHPCERPVHEVWVDAFRIAATPVANEEYAAISWTGRIG